jgi:hypothetical protein
LCLMIRARLDVSQGSLSALCPHGLDDPLP